VIARSRRSRSWKPRRRPALLDDWFDPIEAALRDQVRSFIQATIEAELEVVLARPRYGRQPKADPENADGPRELPATAMAIDRDR